MTHPDLREVPTYETWRKISELRNNPTQGSRWPTSKPTRTTSYPLINIMKVEMFSNRHGPFFKWKLSREIVSSRASDTDYNLCHTVSFTTQDCGIASSRCQVISLPAHNICRWRIDSWSTTNPLSSSKTVSHSCTTTTHVTCLVLLLLPYVTWLLL